MKTHKLRVCSRCGEMFEVKGGFKNQHLCPECREEQYWQKRPSPEKKGLCVCWFDGLDCEISECDQRRKIARERLAEGKPYIMPQCAACTEDIPKKPELTFFCGFCYSKFDPTTPSQRHCCQKCKDAEALRQRKIKADIKAKREANRGKA